MPVPLGFAAARIPFVHVSDPGTYGVVTFGVFPNTLTDPVGLADDVFACYVATMHGRLDNSFRAGPVQLSIGTPSGDLTVEGANSAVGVRSDEMEAPNVALLIQKRTALGGRQNRGRFFWPFMLSQDDLSETGNLSGTALSDTQDEADAFLAALDAAEVPMVLFHRGSSDTTDVNQLLVEPRAATQRRRLRR